MPQKAGDRVNTDRRDARHRARLMRSGARTPVSRPQGDDDARRDLRRAREARLRDLNAAPYRLQAFLRRQDLRDTSQAQGRPAQLRGRAAVVCPTPAHPIVFPQDGRAVTAHTARRQRLQQALPEWGNTWRLAPGGEALPALRGGPVTVAVMTVAA